jgi:hypothetical protein
MTGLTFYFGDDDVSAMREENLGRQTPNSLPWNLLSLFPECAQLFYFSAFGISTRVASKTQGSGRTARNGAFLGTLMAARARQIKIQMSFMRKCDGLVDAAVHPV